MSFLDFFNRRPVPKEVEGPEIFLNKNRARREPAPDDRYFVVVCPYCLSKSHVWDLEFRANCDSDTVEGNGIQRFYPEEEDAEYARFWEDMKEPRDARKPFVLRVGDTENVRAVRLWGSSEWLDVSTAEGLDRIHHRAVCQVKDKFGNTTKERICPHCHNTLPELIGQYPNYIFSLIGNTSSGKTVYLQRLKSSVLHAGPLPGRMMSLQLLDESTLHVDQETRRMFVDTVQQQEKISDATSVGYMKPVIMELQQGEEHILITLFDFPGEAIWEENRTPFFKSLMQRNSENTDGWLFILDSTTLPAVRSCVQACDEEELLSVKLSGDSQRDAQESAEPMYILSEFTKAFGLGNQVKCPVAFTFSKSDIIRYFVQKDDPNLLPGLNEETLFLQQDLKPKRDKVELDELHRCSRELERFLEEDMVVTNARNSCPLHAWFAVSATGVEVRDGILQAVAPPCRVTDPLEWLLWMMGAVPGVANRSKGWARQLGASTPGEERRR